MCTSVFGSNLLSMKSDFIFFFILMLVNLNSDFDLKLNDGLDRFLNGSNLYLYCVMDNVDVKELNTEIIKCCVNMEQPSGIVSKTRGGLMVFLSV